MAGVFQNSLIKENPVILCIINNTMYSGCTKQEPTPI